MMTARTSQRGDDVAGCVLPFCGGAIRFRAGSTESTVGQVAASLALQIPAGRTDFSPYICHRECGERRSDRACAAARNVRWKRRDSSRRPRARIGRESSVKQSPRMGETNRAQDQSGTRRLSPSFTGSSSASVQKLEKSGYVIPAAVGFISSWIADLEHREAEMATGGEKPGAKATQHRLEAGRRREAKQRKQETEAGTGTDRARTGELRKPGRRRTPIRPSGTGADSRENGGLADEQDEQDEHDEHDEHDEQRRARRAR